MGIDIYLKWKGQTKEEHDAQITGFSIHSGDVGYLRESYHGDPYATRVLLPEAFAEDAPEGGVRIPIETLTARLEGALLATLVREVKLYSNGRDPALVKAVDPEEAVRAILPTIVGRMKSASNQPADWIDDAPPSAVTPAVMQLALWRAHGWLPPHAQSFVDFVALADRLEKEGKEPTIYASY